MLSMRTDGRLRRLCQKCSVCGKKADTAGLQDKLTGTLIGLARAAEGNENLVAFQFSVSVPRFPYSALGFWP